LCIYWQSSMQHLSKKGAIPGLFVSQCRRVSQARRSTLFVYQLYKYKYKKCLLVHGSAEAGLTIARNHSVWKVDKQKQINELLHLSLFANMRGSLSAQRRRPVTDRLRSVGSRLWTILLNSFLVCCWRRVGRLSDRVKNTTFVAVFTVANNDLTSSPLDCFKCIRLFRFETGVPDWACIFRDRSNVGV